MNSVLQSAAWRCGHGGADGVALPQPAQSIPLQGRAILQGVLFGSLFGLLALWVRKVGAGNCFDFGMVLTTYGVGRFIGTTPFSPRLAPGLPYLLIAGLLSATQLVPGWGAVLLFLPMGLAAAGSDGHLAEVLAPQGDLGLGWQMLERSATLGGLVGSVVIGAASQAVGLEKALPIEVAAFALAALLRRA
jgi:hypothetical protein